MKNIFKRLSLLFLSSILIFSLCACVSKELDDDDDFGGIEGGGDASFDNVEDSAQDSVDSLPDDYTTITLTDDSSTYSGSGVEIRGNVITISQEGSYQISGTLSNGSINVTLDGNAYLFLNGVSVTNLQGSALNILGKKKKIISLQENTQNYFTDGNSYEDTAQEANACVFAKNDLTINGTGSLTVKGNYNNGIGSKQNLKISGGNVNVTAVNNALKGNDSVVIKNCSVVATSSSDGIKSDSEEAGLGYIYIDGDVNVTSNGDGITSFNDLEIAGGNVDVKSGGGSTSNASFSGIDSNKGLKCNSGIVISGGIVNLNSKDDTIHANLNVIINCATITASSGDDGIHANKNLEINGGNINITKSYEGLEAQYIIINDGDTKIVASDDGINACDGNSSTTTAFAPTRPGGNTPGGGGMGSASTDCSLTVNGGKVYVNAVGDGLDSNGSMYFNGGYVAVDGPTDNGNGAIDKGDGSDCQILFNGGTLIAVGSSGMAETPSTNSTCYTIFYKGTTISANTVITVKDSSGNVVLTHTCAKQSASMVLGSNAYISGKAYSVYKGSTLIKTVTISNKVTTIS